MSVTLTSKGQVTIPKAVRNRLHLKEGDKLEFVLHEHSVEIIPLSGSVKDLKGMVSKPKKVISLDEMDSVIREQTG
ncbi:AbrB/MazE/SpoVT family DNA-binding domain-containing protein [Ghiorsea bivora]|uniref:AbrB/MazE/SpoVT family DNA-binding domain-containing protein n=1 Tax=Ghiorsea bivora TaxID=1485545 RepID=UPI0005700C7A|nr:AbrB/MazE/SpoVT family DNA-binding domain-containing protein [Ghiorsea bivora]